ncbi:MAG: hypothetical protein V4510_00715 [bacterium]
MTRKHPRNVQVFPAVLLLVTAVGASVMTVAPTADSAVSSGLVFWSFGMDNHAGMPGCAAGCTQVAFADPFPTAATVKATSCASGTSSFYPVAGSSSNPGFSYANVAGTAMTSNGLYMISSTAPIGVSQLNDHDPAMASNDVSQLLPETDWGTDYVITTYTPLSPSEPAEIVVIASVPTTVTVTPTVTTTAGGGLPAMAAGMPYSFALPPCTAAQIEAPNDLTGSLVTADQPIGVLEGTRCSNIILLLACDHIEEQVWPRSSWGSTYILCRSPLRGSEGDLVRIMALVPGATSVTVSGTPYALPSAYSYVDVTVTSDAAIVATHAVSVVEYLKGEMETGSPSGQGDPAMTQLDPVTAFYPVYSLYHFPGPLSARFAMVAAPTGSSVLVDGAALTGFSSVGSSGYSCARASSMAIGLHTVAGPAAGISVQYGAYGNAASYLAPAFRGGATYEVRGGTLYWAPTTPGSVVFKGQWAGNLLKYGGATVVPGAIVPWGILDFGDGTPPTTLSGRVTSVVASLNYFLADWTDPAGAPVTHAYVSVAAPSPPIGWTAVAQGPPWLDNPSPSLPPGVIDHHDNNPLQPSRFTTTVTAGALIGSPIPAFTPVYVCAIARPCKIPFSATNPPPLGALPGPIYRFATTPEAGATFAQPWGPLSIDATTGIVTWTPPPVLVYPPGSVNRDYFSIAVVAEIPGIAATSLVIETPIQSLILLCDPDHLPPGMPPGQRCALPPDCPETAAGAATKSSGLIVSHGGGPLCLPYGTLAATRSYDYPGVPGSWFPIAPAIVPRAQAAGAAGEPQPLLGEEDYWVFGGVGPSSLCTGPGGTCDKVERYQLHGKILPDPLTSTWSLEPNPMPTPRAGLSAVYVNSKVLVFGGAQCAGMYCGTPLSTFETYNVVGKTWSTTGAMPTPREDLAAAGQAWWVDNACLPGGVPEYIYLVGGNTGLGTPDLTRVDVYDYCGGTWLSPTLVPPLPYGVSGAVAGICTSGPSVGNLYVIGGVHAGLPANRIQTYIPATPGIPGGGGWVTSFLPSAKTMMARSQIAGPGLVAYSDTELGAYNQFSC